MSTHTAFNTHNAVKKLVKAGVKESQAEAIVETVSQGREYDLSQLATKLDIADVKREIAEIKIELLKWYIGSTIAIISVMIACFKFFGD